MLNGLSVIYSDKEEIKSDLESIFKWDNRIEWSYSNSLIVEDFSNLMTKIWCVHPYREGYTRTFSVFMKLFAETKGLNFNDQLLSVNAAYLRSALVLAAVEESPEPKYLLKIISDALYASPSQKVDLDDEVSSSYQVIDQYDVSECEEKPFEIEFDKNNTEK